MLRNTETTANQAFPRCRPGKYLKLKPNHAERHGCATARPDSRLEGLASVLACLTSELIFCGPW